MSPSERAASAHREAHREWAVRLLREAWADLIAAGRQEAADAVGVLLLRIVIEERARREAS